MIETKREVKIRAIDRSQQFMEITDFNSMILQNIQLCARSRRCAHRQSYLLFLPFAAFNNVFAIAIGTAVYLLNRVVKFGAFHLTDFRMLGLTTKLDSTYEQVGKNTEILNRILLELKSKVDRKDFELLKKKVASLTG